MLEIFPDGGEDVVRWSSRFGGRFGFGPRSGSQILREVLYMVVPQLRWKAGETSFLHAARMSQAFTSILRSCHRERVFLSVGHPY